MSLERTVKYADEQFGNEAWSASEIIVEIEKKWMERLKKEKEGGIQFPFGGDYSCVVKHFNGKDFIYVEGYSGILTIKHLFFRGKMYRLTKPIHKNRYKIYGKFKSDKTFMGFVSNSNAGAHSTGMDVDYFHQLCIGDLVVKDGGMDSFIELRKLCQDIIKSYEVINTESLGNVQVGNKKINRMIRVADIGSLLKIGYIKEAIL